MPTAQVENYYMKTAILITTISNFGDKTFYHSQETGLAKALARLGHTITIYKLSKQPQPTQIINENISVKFIVGKSIGINGLFNPKQIDTDITALIHFSDTQFSVPTVYRYCKRKDITYIPYIGVIRSHSNNAVIRTVTDFLFLRNRKIYQKCVCLTKTPSVKEQLKKIYITNTKLAPVGLDMEILKNNYQNYSVHTLKEKYGYRTDEKIILFSGRMTKEKNPLLMLEIFSDILKTDSRYRLIMVGSGELENAVRTEIQKLHLENAVRIIPKIPNAEMWELYRIADCFVNLNRNEIFGMSVLEAMYYGCKVVAFHAFGTDFIIENKINGYLVSNKTEMENCICHMPPFSENAHNRIVQHFTSQTTAEIIHTIITDKEIQ